MSRERYGFIYAAIPLVEHVPDKVYHYNLVSGALEHEQYEDAVTCLALRRSGQGVSDRPVLFVQWLLTFGNQLACATSHGFAVIEEGSKLRYLNRPLPEAFQPFTRFNDGACDKNGRFVAGTLYDKEHEVPGQLYIYDAERDACELLEPGPFTVYRLSQRSFRDFRLTALNSSTQDSNGLGWTNDGKTMWV